jgi:hypothetical protein
MSRAVRAVPTDMFGVWVNTTLAPFTFPPPPQKKETYGREGFLTVIG